MSTRLVLAIVSTVIWEALLVGSALFILPQLGIELPLPVVVLLVVGLGAFGVVSYRVGSAALRRKPLVGLPLMVGSRGRVVKPLAPLGMVLIKGELWEAVSTAGNLGVGEQITVVGHEALRLTVERVKKAG